MHLWAPQLNFLNLTELEIFFRIKIFWGFAERASPLISCKFNRITDTSGNRNVEK